MLNITITEFYESQEPLILDAWNFTGEEAKLKDSVDFCIQNLSFCRSINRQYPQTK